MYSSGQWSYACLLSAFPCVLGLVLYIFRWVLFIYLCDAFGLFYSTMPCCVEDFLWHLNVLLFGDFLEHLNVSMQHCEYENTLYRYYGLLCLSMVLLMSSSLCGCCRFHRPSGLSIDNHCCWFGAVSLMVAWYYGAFIVRCFCCFVATQSILVGAYLKCWFSISCNCENYSYVYFLVKTSWDFLKMHRMKTISNQLALLLIDLL